MLGAEGQVGVNKENTGQNTLDIGNGSRGCHSLRETAGQESETCEGGRHCEHLCYEGWAAEAPQVFFQGSPASPTAFIGGAELMSISASEGCPEALYL